MNKICYGIVFALLPLVLFSCKKEQEEEHETNSAEITITQPMPNDELPSNDTLAIRGTIVSVLDLHGYNISIKKASDQTEVFSFEDHYHGMNKNLNVNWPCTLNENAELQLTITATLDHDGHTASKTVNFHCHM